MVMRKSLEATVEPALVVDACPAAILVVMNEAVVFMNPSAQELLGLDFLPGHALLSVQALTVPQEQAVMRQWLTSVREGSRDPITVRVPLSDGRLAHVRFSAQPLQGDRCGALVLVAIDVTDTERVRQQLQRLAFVDPLTDLPNRFLVLDRLTATLRRASRYHTSFAVLMIDLDGFKSVNDKFGHDAGDLVLRVVSQRLLTAVRESDTVARLGGDEFVVLLDPDRDEIASQIAGRIIEQVGRPIEVANQHVNIGASIGIASFPREGDTVDELLTKADMAMYASKSKGKGRWSIFDAPLRERMSRDKTFVLWIPGHTVGVAVIDSQHEELSALINALAVAIADGVDAAAVRSQVAALASYANFHFDTEEQLMDEHKVPLAAAHKREHRRLREELKVIDRNIEQQGLSLTLASLKDWFVNHTRQSDDALGRALNLRGVR